MKCLTLTILCLLGSLLVVNGQSDVDGWLRVMTDEDSVTEIDRVSLIIGPKHLIGAKYRTVLSTTMPVPGTPNVIYKTRIDTIQFDTRTRSYRISESAFFDTSQKSVLSFVNSDSNVGWKQLRGRTALRLFSAASQLRPFGTWKVISYHYASGEGPAMDDPSELRDLIGRNLILGLDQLFIGKSNCVGPTFEAHLISDAEISKKYGLSIKDLGIAADSVNVMRIACNSNKAYPPYILVILQTTTRAKLLWDGVFLEIERPGNQFLP